MQAHPYPERLAQRPVLGDERALCVERGSDAIMRETEHCVQTVASRLHDVTVVLFDRVAQDLVVAGERRPHLFGMLVPQARRAFKVGEQEGDGARGWRRAAMWHRA